MHRFLSVFLQLDAFFTSCILHRISGQTLAKPTGFKLELRLLSELAPGEGEAVPGLLRLQRCGPADGGENRHQHPQQGTYKETEPPLRSSEKPQKDGDTCRLREMTNMWAAELRSEEREKKRLVGGALAAQKGVSSKVQEMLCSWK